MGQVKGASSGVCASAGAASVYAHYAVKLDTSYLWPQRRILGKSLLDSKCISVTLFLDLELRWDMLAQSLPAWKLSVTSSLLDSYCPPVCITRVHGSWDLWHWGEVRPKSRSVSREVSLNVLRDGSLQGATVRT